MEEERKGRREGWGGGKDGEEGRKGRRDITKVGYYHTKALTQRHEWSLGHMLQPHTCCCSRMLQT